MKYIHLIIWLVLHTSIQAQEKTLQFTEGRFRVFDECRNEDGYYIFYDTSSLGKFAKPLVFTHGYGALNPMIYGQWIKHLTQQGLTVIFPRYQKNLLAPGAEKFAENTVSAIKEAFSKLFELGYTGLDTSTLIFAGHSYGGAISAYLGLNYKKYGLPKPAGLFLCQPGTGPLKPLNLNDYSDLDTLIKLIVLVGDRDMTVGDILGKRIYTTVKNTEKIYLKHYENSEVDPPISASHYEAYSLDSLLDNNIHNFTYKRSLYMAKTDEVDYHLYWYLLDHLYASIKNRTLLSENVELSGTRIFSISAED